METLVSLQEALEVIKKHQERGVPVQVVPLANELGMSVYRVPNWSTELSGMIKRTGNSPSGFDIFVNATHPETRRRFTIAHEIAHAVLHPHLIGDGITDDALLRSGLSDAVEAQANRMAADILMPWKKINEHLDEGNTEVEDLARIFNVSPQSMAIRLGVPQ